MSCNVNYMYPQAARYRPETIIIGWRLEVSDTDSHISHTNQKPALSEPSYSVTRPRCMNHFPSSLSYIGRPSLRLSAHCSGMSLSAEFTIVRSPVGNISLFHWQCYVQSIIVYVLIFGTLRGIAHAGMDLIDPRGAVVVALSLRALQVRIGPFITTPGKSSSDRKGRFNPKIAYSENGSIVIDTYRGDLAQRLIEGGSDDR